MSKFKTVLNLKTIYWLGIFTLLIYLFLGNVLSVDDMYYNFLADAKITMQREYFYGTWVMPVQNFLLYYLPYKSGVNLQDWAQYFGAFIQAVCFFVLIKYFSKFFELSKVSQKLNLALTTISFMFLFCLLYTLKFRDILIYSGFFRFFLPACLIVIWSFYFYKIFKGQLYSVSKLILFCLFSFLTASSSEITGTICVCSALCLTIYSYLNKKENRKNLLIIFSALAIGLLLLLLTKGFQEHFEGKLQSGIFSFSIIKANFLPFLKVCIKRLFPINWLLFFLFFGFIYANRKFGKEEIIFSSSLMISIILFSLSLVVLGKTHYSGSFWIMHNDIFTVFYGVYTVILIVLSLNLLKILSNKYLIIIFALLIPLFLLSVVHLRTSIENIKDFTYLRDKMMLYYMQKKEKIVLPYALYGNAFYSLYSHIYNFNEFLEMYKIEDYSDKEKEFVRDYSEAMYYNYYPFLYNFKYDGECPKIEFADGKEAMKIFENSGGNYDEISKHKYHFYDLELKQ